MALYLKGAKHFVSAPIYSSGRWEQSVSSLNSMQDYALFVCKDSIAK